MMSPVEMLFVVVKTGAIVPFVGLFWESNMQILEKFPNVVQLAL
jgi:hypothetical protein